MHFCSTHNFSNIFVKTKKYKYLTIAEKCTFWTLKLKEKDDFCLLGECGRDLAEWLEALPANAEVATLIDSIPHWNLRGGR
jgi:hypothetical protein